MSNLKMIDLLEFEKKETTLTNDQMVNQMSALFQRENFNGQGTLQLRSEGFQH